VRFEVRAVGLKAMREKRGLTYLDCRFEDLFDVVLVNPETSEVRVLHPVATKP
jgi:hypothetical protein